MDTNSDAQFAAAAECYDNVFAHDDTIECVLCNKCIPCLYKIFPNGGSELDSAIQKQFPPNIRPEMCPRFHSTASDSKYRGIIGNKSRILTVGDGDFSFSLSLMSPQRKKRLTATSYESYESIAETYTTGTENIRRLKEYGVKVINGVDATKLPEYEEIRKDYYDIIVWNFPCIGLRNARSSDGQVNELEANKQLLSDFFKCAPSCLRPDGYNEVHITHKTIEPFSWWKIEEIASNNGFVCEGRIIFDRCLYPGYINRKALDKKSFPAHDARTFVFRFGGKLEDDSSKSTLRKFKHLRKIDLDCLRALVEIIPLLSDRQLGKRKR